MLTEADVLITAALAERPTRQPDLRAENQAFATLAQQLTDDPQSRLKTLVQVAKDLCQAGTVGVSLQEVRADGNLGFRWVAIAGALGPGAQTALSDLSPWPMAVRSGEPQLYAHPERYFTGLGQLPLPIVEAMLVPICVNDQPLGTLWLLTHTEQRPFNCEDLRLITSLTGFAAAALQSKHLHQTAELGLQAEQALRQSEERFQAFMNHSPTASWITDRDGRMVYLSQTYFRIFQFPHQDVIGKTVFELYPRAIAQQFLDNIRQAADTQTVVETTEVAPRSDGTMGDFLVYKFPITDKFEEVLIGGVAIDITDRKQSEEALRNSAEQLSLALMASKLGDWSWDAATDVVTFSAKAAEIFGIPPGPHMTWTQMQTILHPDDRELARSQVEQAIANHSDYDVEYRVIHSDQTERWVSAKGRAQYDPRGQLLGMLGVVQDINHRKQAEVVRLRLAEERERLLAREKAAREEAETANRVKDEFLAVLSHELRSPLNPILGWAKLLRSGKLDPVRTAEALATIERNAKLQAQLIEDLLDISRIMQGKLLLNATPVSLAFVISSAIETVRLAAEAKSIGITVHIEPNVGQIAGDTSRLQQVVWNLLTNAIKFTPAGGGVDVRLTQLNRQVRLQVSDTGKGITPEFLPYVFEHFRQEDGATTRKFGGLGLGLAIAKQIATLHGGKIWVESPGEDQGATFTVELPCLSAVPVEEVTPTQIESGPLPLAHLRVLIVDDDPDSREFVMFVVEQAGAEVTAVNSACQALQHLATTPFDLLLSDIGMPEMDGYELMRQLAQLQELGGQAFAASTVPLPKAIALTAYAGELDQQQALAAGFQGHITKPVEPDDLIKTIVAVIGSR